MVFAVNDATSPLKGARVSARIYDRLLKLVKTDQWSLTVPADGHRSAEHSLQYTIPASTPDGYFFLDLTLADSSGKILSRQAYWLRLLKSLTDPAERKKREIDPIAEPQNQKGPWLKPQLESLPTSLKAALLSVETTGAEAEIHISIKNSGSLSAYPVRLTVAPDLYPVLWSDNYFMLAPGESRQISGTVRLDLKGIDPIKNPPIAKTENLTVEVSAWNAKAIKVMQAK